MSGYPPPPPVAARGRAPRSRRSSVTGYSTAAATLALAHGAGAAAAVDVRLVLETLHPDTAHVGAWVNVMGYVTGTAAAAAAVQAVAVWPAGPLDAGRYERFVGGAEE